MKSGNAAIFRCGSQIPSCLNCPCLSWQLAHNISEDDAPENHSGEAAALFLLALRHQHASLDRALAGCHITWNENATTEKVEYLT
jgi:hypothetical protein